MNEEDLIIQNYQRDILNLACVELEMKDEEEGVTISCDVSPHSHYDFEGQTYLVFFNSKFEDLHIALNKLLDDWCKRITFSGVLKDKAAKFGESEEEMEKYSIEKQIKTRALLTKKKKGEILANLIYNLNTCMHLFGAKHGIKKRVALVFSKSLRDPGRVLPMDPSIEEAFFSAAREKDDYEQVKQYYEILNSIVPLDGTMKRTEEEKEKEKEKAEFKRNAQKYGFDFMEQMQIKYSFTVCRTHRYLSVLERDLHRRIEVLKLMDNLRRILIKQMLRYTFEYQENATPFSFEVMIPRCQIIGKSKEGQMIYVDRRYAKDYRDELMKKLVSQAAELLGDYYAGAKSGEELAKLATDMAQNKSHLQIYIDQNRLLTGVDDQIQRIDRKKEKAIWNGFSEAGRGLQSLAEQQTSILTMICGQFFPPKLAQVLTSIMTSFCQGKNDKATNLLDSLENADLVRIDKCSEQLGVTENGVNMRSEGMSRLISDVKTKGFSEKDANYFCRMFGYFLHAGRLSKKIASMRKFKDALITRDEYAKEFIEIFKLLTLLNQLDLDDTRTQGVLIAMNIRNKFGVVEFTVQPIETNMNFSSFD